MKLIYYYYFFFHFHESSPSLPTLLVAFYALYTLPGTVNGLCRKSLEHLIRLSSSSISTFSINLSRFHFPCHFCFFHFLSPFLFTLVILFHSHLSSTKRRSSCVIFVCFKLVKFFYPLKFQMFFSC